MNTVNELEEKINKITSVIRTDYPELLKYLNEMPETIPNGEHPKIDEESLSKYYDTLVNVFRDYVAEHQLQNINRKYTDHHL